jgi:hypothetical protein
MYFGGKVKGKKSEEALHRQFGDKRGKLHNPDGVT